MNKRRPDKKRENTPKGARANVFALLTPYKGFVLFLTIFTMAGNAVSLVIPKLIAKGIDDYGDGTLVMQTLVIEFAAVSVLMLLFTYLQGVFQTYLSERSAMDLRTKVSDKISRLSFANLEKETPGKLLTNLTSDIDAIKMFVSRGIVTIISSFVLIIGSAILLLSIDWRLALAVLALLPLIGVLFIVVFKKLGPLFRAVQEIIDRINAVISESIVGAALVRVVHSESHEMEKFEKHNREGMENGMKILKYFSLMIPSISIIANLAILLILALGGKFVIEGSMSLGNFTAFNSYVYILIFPIIMLGFVSSILSRAQESYGRIMEVTKIEDEKNEGISAKLSGGIEIKNVTIMYGEKKALNDVSFKILPGSKNSIIGPTAAGKTQLVHALIGLIKPTSGDVFYDGKPLSEYSKESIHSQIAIVFQDSVIFNMSLRENIAFNKDADARDVEKAIKAAELSDFISSLPDGLDTKAAERGTSLSGGQKQRIMLARALAINPKVLLLDDFTARVDQSTEEKILSNIEKLYPDLTVISVTQKIGSIEKYDQVILLMEGEVIASGTHIGLASSSPEYVQIMESQKSTETIERQ
jgi:ATP-binding cassette, subfamily B, bacterial